ncbi:pyridoxamine 5'-phosphate oxidase family protein [Streptomyces kaniharaensis]|uniref:Pyridoxamine 5'-phosphate oxidase family protein n=1 Tax=Streptomyces kaniharaensis TaxID=212423 RepID=A0A6N7L592_9ACTN|nr:pyridoxamine 5'-phosphate oxidase family protein [Streptomyces kaniharaensis]MQS17123.1 pyridoxamine 5'-phosphate oxidase family protein [Streptomyces kaniharaensis]
MLAHRAAMAPAYLRQLLRAGPEFDPPGFVRIAAVLGMAWPELLSGRRPDATPGQAEPEQTEPGPRPMLLHLTEPQCWELIGTHGVGRVGLPVQPGPLVLPVNYAVDAGTVVYRTAPGGAAAPSEGSPVSFQVDHIDERRSRGWSVLILGEAHHVDDLDEEQRLSALPGTTPWAGGSRPLWVRVRPDEVTGRRIATA